MQSLSVSKISLEYHMFLINFLKGWFLIPEAEHMNSKHAGILFHRFMLQDLRECVQKLGAESFAEIKGYEEPPALVHNIVKAVLLLFNPNWKGSEKTESWSQCIQVSLFFFFSVTLSLRRYSGICQG